MVVVGGVVSKGVLWLVFVLLPEGAGIRVVSGYGDGSVVTFMGSFFSLFL